MEKGVAILLAFMLIITGVGAYRNKESVGRGGADIKQSAETRDFCVSPRCDGYTDKEESSDKQLKFRFPNEGINIDPMGRAEVAMEKGYEGYHHGSLKECIPVTGIFSYFRDWAMHMQTNLREGIWPNQPGQDTKYTCAERCKLRIFNDKGERLNKGNEPEIWVERDGHSGDLLSGVPFLGWSPATCTVGNALQTHWWKQQFNYTNNFTVMVDPEGLPVFPHGYRHPILRKKFTELFCALTKEQKISVTSRVTSHRPNRWKYGRYYSEAMGRLRSRNYFPEGFPRECDDGWKASNAEGVTRYA